MGDLNMGEIARIHEAPVMSFTQEARSLIRRTVCSNDINDLEFELFLAVAERSGLDPVRRQIHAVKRGGKMTIQTAIDGYRVIARRNGLAGIDEPVFETDDKGNLLCAKVTVYRWGAHGKEAYTGVAYWSEYCPSGGQDHMWRKMPRNQLAKCAEAQAIRKGFQESTQGIYIDDEAHIGDEIVIAESGKRVQQLDQTDDEAEMKRLRGELEKLLKSKHMTWASACKGKYGRDITRPTLAETQGLIEWLRTVDVEVEP